jgi:hypothetical protein
MLQQDTSRDNGREREGPPPKDVAPVKAPGFGQQSGPPAKPGVR